MGNEEIETPEYLLSDGFFDGNGDECDEYSKIVDDKEDEEERKNSKEKESDESEFDLKKYEKSITSIEKKFDYLLSYGDSTRKYIKVIYQGKSYEVKPLAKFKKSGKYVLETRGKEKIAGFPAEFEIDE